MTRKQRAAPQSAPPKGQTAPTPRQLLRSATRARSRRNEGRRRTPTPKHIRRCRPAPHGGWKRRRRDLAKSSGAPMTRDRNTSLCGANRRSQSSTPPSSNDCCRPARRSSRSSNSWKSLYVEGLDLTRDRDLGRDTRALIGWLLDTNVIAAPHCAERSPERKGMGAHRR